MPLVGTVNIHVEDKERIVHKLFFFVFFSIDCWFPGSGWNTESDPHSLVQTALPSRLTRPGKPLVKYVESWEIVNIIGQCHTHNIQPSLLAYC